MEPVALNRAALFTAAKAYRRTGNMYNRFGTTQEMMIQTVQENGTEAVLAIDSRGLYLTTAQFVGRPIADRNRYSGVRKEMPQRLAALGLDEDALVAANQHRIQVETLPPRRSAPSRPPSVVPRARLGQLPGLQLSILLSRMWLKMPTCSG